MKLPRLNRSNKQRVLANWRSEPALALLHILLPLLAEFEERGHGFSRRQNQLRLAAYSQALSKCWHLESDQRAWADGGASLIMSLASVQLPGAPALMKGIDERRDFSCLEHPGQHHRVLWWLFSRAGASHWNKPASTSVIILQHYGDELHKLLLQTIGKLFEHNKVWNLDSSYTLSSCVDMQHSLEYTYDAPTSVSAETMDVLTIQPERFSHLTRKNNTRPHYSLTLAG